VCQQALVRTIHFGQQVVVIASCYKALDSYVSSVYPFRPSHYRITTEGNTVGSPTRSARTLTWLLLNGTIN
jgi:hypothetical protein